MAPKPKTVKVEMTKTKEHKSVVRFDSDDDALSNAYIGKDALKKLGNPDEITITISA